MKTLIKIIAVLIIFFLGYAAGSFLPLSSFGNNENSNFVAPENLIEGATEFGSLKVILTDTRGAFIDNIEVDVGEHPGGKMAVEVTDKNGVALFEKMPAGNYVIFFNDNTFPKNFERVPSLIPVKITKGQATEQKIELRELK